MRCSVPGHTSWTETTNDFPPVNSLLSPAFCICQEAVIRESSWNVRRKPEAVRRQPSAPGRRQRPADELERARERVVFLVTAFVKYATRLENLSIKDNCLPDQSCMMLAAGLSERTGLKSLDLSNNRPVVQLFNHIFMHACLTQPASGFRSWALLLFLLQYVETEAWRGFLLRGTRFRRCRNDPCRNWMYDMVL